MKKMFLGVLMAAVMAGCAVVPVLPAKAAKSEICNGINDATLTEYAGCSSSGEADVYKTANNIIKTVLLVIGVIAVFVAIYGGITMIISNGDPGKFAKGQKILIYGAIGVVVALAAYAVVYFVLKKVG